MGSETAFYATECSQALNYLALAGYNTEEMCKTLPTVLNLAESLWKDIACKRNQRYFICMMNMKSVYA